MRAGDDGAAELARGRGRPSDIPRPTAGPHAHTSGILNHHHHHHHDEKGSARSTVNSFIPRLDIGSGIRGWPLLSIVTNQFPRQEDRTGHPSRILTATHTKYHDWKCGCLTEPVLDGKKHA